jgi:hypothetical protein
LSYKGAKQELAHLPPGLHCSQGGNVRLKRQSAVPIAYVKAPRFRKQILVPEREIRRANLGELVGKLLAT